MLTYDQIQPYLQYQELESIPANLKHEYYDASKQYRVMIDELFAEKYPEYLNKNRPRERAADKKYREEIYKNTWEHLPDRVSETLDYIHQADDFGVAFPSQVEGVNEKYTLEKYLGKSLTPDGDLTEWFFNNVVDLYLKDPNACTAMVLTDLPSLDPEFSTLGFYKPIPMLFPAQNVLMHQKGRFAVMEAPEKRPYKDSDGKKKMGRVLHFWDDESYTAAFEVGQDKGGASGFGSTVWQIIGISTETVFNENLEPAGTQITLSPILHHFDSMPVFKIGKRRTKCNSKREELYKSILHGAKAKIIEAQQVQNDIEAERNFHVTSSEWRRKSAFPACQHPGCVSGTIYPKDANGNPMPGAPKKCPSCNGTGLNPSSGSSLEILMVNDSVSERTTLAHQDVRPQTPGAPGGYIERSIDPIKQLTSDLKDVSDDVYQIINMQFIRTTPNEASGTSKRYDREELYRELNTQAAHLLNILKRQYAMGDNIRYTLHTAYVGKQTPDIMIPVRFNLENAELTREELNDAKTKKYDPALIAVLEMKLLEYNVGKSAPEYLQYQTRVKLDPFRNINVDQKNMYIGMYNLVLNPGEGKNKMVGNVLFSMNFDSYMIRAELEHADFYTKKIEERADILRKFFEEEFAGGLREFNMTVDPVTGQPAMPQFAVKPPVNIQDTNQTDTTVQGDGIFSK